MRQLLALANIFAPFAGVVTRRWVEPGRQVKSSAPVLTISDQGVRRDSVFGGQEMPWSQIVETRYVVTPVRLYVHFGLIGAVIAMSLQAPPSAQEDERVARLRAYGVLDPDQPVAIGSGKTNVGHLESAAGVAGLIKVVQALRHGLIPAQLHFETPNPHIPWSELNVKVASTTTRLCQ